MATISTNIISVRHDLSRALVITRRELRDMMRDWRIIVPIIILTVIFPQLMNITAGAATRFAERYGALIVGERLIPFLLMVVGFFPISVSLVIALETFVGEKERRSLEPLLNTPLTNVQLYIGKMLAATLPPLIASYLGIIVYLVGLYFNLGWTPPLNLLILIVLLTTLQAIVMVAGAVVVSSQTTSVRAANLLASYIIIPMAFLVQAEALIMFWARYHILWSILGGLAIMGIVLVRMGVRIFNREELLGREIDELNLSRSIKNLWSLIKGEAEQATPEASGASKVVRRGLRWYRREVFAALRRSAVPAVFVLLALIGGGLVGVQQAGVWTIPSESFEIDQWASRLDVIMSSIGLSGTRGALLVLWQNVRVLALGSVLGVFTFGVLTVEIAMLPSVIIGYLGAHIYANGINPAIFWAAIVPHGILEIPAILLATGIIMRLGAGIISPPTGKTLGEAWTMTIADAIKLWFGVILPLLVLAAIVEVFLTPRIVLAVAGAGG